MRNSGTFFFAAISFFANFTPAANSAFCGKTALSGTFPSLSVHFPMLKKALYFCANNQIQSPPIPFLLEICYNPCKKRSNTAPLITPEVGTAKGASI